MGYKSILEVFYKRIVDESIFPRNIDEFYMRRGRNQLHNIENSQKIRTLISKKYN